MEIDYHHGECTAKSLINIIFFTSTYYIKYTLSMESIIMWEVLANNINNNLIFNKTSIAPISLKSLCVIMNGHTHRSLELLNIIIVQAIQDCFLN